MIKLEIVGGVIKSYCCEEKLEIPEGVTVIGEGAFAEFKGLTSIKIPGCVTKLESYAFMSCLDLKTVELSEGLAEIGNAAFGVCVSLQRINIPDSVEIIHPKAFSCCNDLKCIYISKEKVHLLPVGLQKYAVRKEL